MKLADVAKPIVEPVRKQFYYPKRDNCLDLFGDNDAFEHLLGKGSCISTSISIGDEVFVLVYAVDLVDNRRFCRVNRRTYGDSHNNFEFANEFIQSKLKTTLYREEKGINAKGNSTRLYYIPEAEGEIN